MSEDEGSGEGEPAAVKSTMRKGKVGNKKGKGARMTGAHVERALESANTSVAPPKRTGRSSTSFLPPGPTVSSSHPCINCKPAVTATGEETGEESNGEDGEESNGEGSDVGEAKDVDKLTSHDQLVEAIDLSAKEKEVVRFGPPRGRHQTKSSSNHPEPITEDVDKSTSHDQLAWISIFLVLHLLSRKNLLMGLHILQEVCCVGDPIGEVPQDIAPLAIGHINVTIVQQPPSDAVIENATSLLNVRSPCYDTLGPILKKVAKSYSPVHKHNYHVYILDYKQWSIMGHYNVVVEEDETAVWEEDETGKVTHILLEKDHEQVVVEHY
ncbi:uncharacterized protein LACBIDRAFT_330655 [Laccaria bicolor S238N-H82]|uniref:Predicted protein n=1 Tax=Laccaria bicolor (strain S238N-H82 / ATCC MYA-4686) TaxID=486041 RepID=B0DM15_LACBS|nr:uncharacterized protein LACBIDRAFT_330655 [Laccaria bicolor S238N-H82]EDR04486.1 predicted protein [Laccaria bicolor S238N-H82]|eukprot:XP_001885005.1 predicted protein [Laccaria bicolor S238N-H82]